MLKGFNLNKLELINTCTKILDDSKARDLVNIDVSNNSSLADNMLICTGTSNRHVSAD